MPARVPADVKEAVLKSVDDAVAAGLAHTWVCGLWQVSDSPLHRWRVRRRDTGTLVDRAPGGHPVHALLSEEIAAILDVAERWGTVDRSHRKLAHRGSYEHLVWVSPSTFRRVLIEHGLTLPEPAPRTRTEKRPWPDWLVWEPNRIWIWDATHFTRARRVCFAIVDMVSRKWIDTLVSVEETATQVTVIFEHALQIEGLLELLTDERRDHTQPERLVVPRVVTSLGSPLFSCQLRGRSTNRPGDLAPPAGLRPTDQSSSVEPDDTDFHHGASGALGLPSGDQKTDASDARTWPDRCIWARSWMPTRRGVTCATV